MNPLSWQFATFVIATLLIYYMPVIKSYRQAVLALSGLVFYTWYSPILTLLLVGSILVYSVASYGATWSKHRRFSLVIGVLYGVGVLSLFKFYQPEIISGDDVWGRTIIPLGLSFYTFMGISLTIDAYNRTKTGIDIDYNYFRHLQRTTLYISFFPQITSGPITKARDFFPQIESHEYSTVDWQQVFRWLVLGVFLKTVIADNLKDYTFFMYHPYFEVRGSGTLALMLVGYSVEIFADFAGYSLIAISIAAMFGYRLPQNFNLPYIATSFRDFWSRWHISLSRFFQEYLYISLGGNRKGVFVTCINLMVVMLVCGLWHGFSVTFIAWGLYHGVFMVIDRVCCSGGNFQRFKGVRILLTYIFVAVGWLFFVQYDIWHVVHYMELIICQNDRLFLDPKFLPIIIYVIPVLVYHLMGYYKGNRIVSFVRRCDYVIFGIMLFLIITNSGSFSTFIYFQF